MLYSAYCIHVYQLMLSDKQVGIQTSGTKVAVHSMC